MLKCERTDLSETYLFCLHGKEVRSEGGVTRSWYSVAKGAEKCETDWISKSRVLFPAVESCARKLAY